LWSFLAGGWGGDVHHQPPQPISVVESADGRGDGPPGGGPETRRGRVPYRSSILLRASGGLSGPREGENRPPGKPPPLFRCRGFKLGDRGGGEEQRK